MLQTAQRNGALAQLLIGNPDPVPKKVWRRKKVHGSAEATRRDLLAKEKAEGPQTEQPITHLSLPVRKILTYYCPLQRPQGWRNLAARRGRVGGSWTLWRYTRAR